MGRKPAVWILSLLAAVMLFPSAAQPQAKKATGAKTTARKKGTAPAPQVRMSWQDFISGPDGAKRLASLQAAITKMKSLDSAPKTSADYRRSWEYWANIHGYYGTQSPDGTVAQQIQYLKSQGMQQYVSYYQGITDQTPPDATAKKVWATCQHSGQTQALNFFGWHRMYLYYFERVLRWAANDNTLRLPYWDYTDPSQLELPANFQSASSTLYDEKRNPDINNGSATLDSASTDVNTLLPDPSYFDYESAIEEGVHGYVHCTVGPTCPVAHMGDVPVAGNDPVFYHHHANIDRLWACWQHLHPTPAGAWQDQQFSFVDETGALVTKPVKGFINTSALGYKYENDSNCARPGIALLAVPVAGPAHVGPEAVENKQVLGTAPGVSVKEAITSIDIAVPKPAMQTALAHLEHARDMQLVLRDVTADSQPGVLFNVYLARKDDPSKRERVGTINWFGAFRSHGGKRMTPKKTLRYDVTSEVKALGGPSLSEQGLTVVIEATTGVVPKESAKAVEQPRLAAQAFKKEANVRIGSIELRAAGAPAPKSPAKKKAPAKKK